MPLALDGVRRVIATRAAAAPEVGEESWRVSPFTYDLFGRQPASIAHLAHAVGVRSTALGGRQGSRSLTRLQVRVGFLHRVRPDTPRQAVAQTVSEDAADAAAQVLLRHLMAPGWLTEFRLIADGITPSTLNGGEWFRRDLAFTALGFFSL